MHLIQIITELKTQEDCIKFLESKRWPSGKPICPYCKSERTCKHLHRHQCQTCRKSFSVTVGTIFHHTHLPLQKWLMAIALIADAKKGISSRQLSRNLNLPVKTGYSLAMRIRKAFDVKNPELLGNIFEMDETYVKTDEEDEDDNNSGSQPRGRGAKGQTPIVGIKAKDGSIVARVMNNVKFDTLFSFAKEVITEGSEIHTDEFKSYRKFKKLFNHRRVNHSKEYVTADKIHCNGVEGFWSLLKRGIKGQFHHLTKTYLQEYVNEFCFRYNVRQESQAVVFKKVVERMLLV